MADLLLGLDAGNTVIKAVLFDTAGNQLALAKRDGRSTTPAPGHVERDMNELWANAIAVIGECLAAADADPRSIVAIGCAGHGNGLYLVDGAGEPLLAVQSLDSRAADLAEELGADGNGARLHALCLQEPWPSQTPTLLSWVKRYAPDIYARTATAFLCKDFVTFRLTGRRVSDVSDMSGCGFVRMPGCTYDDDLLAGYGLSDARGMLPDLVQPTEVAGRRGNRACRGNAGGRRTLRCRRERARLRRGLGRTGIDHRRHLEHQPGSQPGGGSRSPYLHAVHLRRRSCHGDRIQRHVSGKPRMVRARTR